MSESTINEAVKGKDKKIKGFISLFTKDNDSGEPVKKKVMWLVRSVRVFMVSAKKFIEDDCFTKASGIAYTTIISLIPTLTVGLTFYSLFSGFGDKKEELIRYIKIFMVEHNLTKLNIDPFFDVIWSLIDNAGKIGSVGTVILIFSATAVLRTLENSLNNIFRVKKARSMIMKMVYYWAALTLGPLIIIAASTVGAQISSAITSPDFKQCYQVENNKWVVGSKGAILSFNKKTQKYDNIDMDRIDLNNQENYVFESERNAFSETDLRIEQLDFKKLSFSKIKFIGSRGWIIGNNGIILMSDDYGNKWNLYRWGSFNFSDIEMFDQFNGVVITKNGYILTTTNGGKSWNVSGNSNTQLGFNQLFFKDNIGIIAAEKGYILYTSDKGLNWELRQLPEAKVKKKIINLNSIYITDPMDIWIAGENGLILHSIDGAKTWITKNFMNLNYFTISFSDKEHGYIGGEKGVFLYTENSGEKWYKHNQPADKINSITHVDNTVIITGDKGLLMSSNDNGTTWKGNTGSNYFLTFINFLAPFLLIWVLFLLVYQGLPNMRIPFKPVAIGASFTSAAWVIFILLFIVYIKAFANGTFAIYGALAAIPIFLLMVYTTTLITLYGAEVTYTLMHPHTYLTLKKHSHSIDDLHGFYAIAILHFIYEKFESGKGNTAFKDLSKITSNRTDEIDYFTQIFVEEGILIKTDDDHFIPANSSQNIKLADILKVIQTISLKIPGYSTGSDQLKQEIKKYFDDLDNAENKLIGDITLNEIIKNSSK